MKGFKYISNVDISQSLLGVTRQYLAGNLKDPQKLSHIHDENIEIGITHYEQSSNEKPHYHVSATEYQYMISGITIYRNVETGDEEEYHQGDFFVIYPNTTYAQKSESNTTILFIKIPSVNDKVVVEIDDNLKDWYHK